MASADGRHISQQTLDRYISAGVKAVVPILGTPEAYLVVDTPNETLQLEVVWDGEELPAIVDYVHISTEVRFIDGRNWALMAVHGLRFFADAYPLLRATIDMQQLESETFALAVRRALDRYHDLLASTGHMSEREEIGLFGELLVLSHLIAGVGPHEALAAWRGGDQREEHDFGLCANDVEVKTTTSEKRRHWISSLDQLHPTSGRELDLLSIQLTGAGASQAKRLPDLIESIVRQLPVGLRNRFDSRLTAAGLRAAQPNDTFRLLRLRTRPTLYRVDDNFPRINSEILERGGASIERIDEVVYTIRLDGVSPIVNPPTELLGFGLENES